MPDDCKIFTDASQAATQGDSVVMPRPPEGLRGGRAGGFEAEKGEDDEDYRFRMLTNIIGTALIAILVGVGVWLAHAIAMVARTG